MFARGTPTTPSAPATPTFTLEQVWPTDNVPSGGFLIVGTHLQDVATATVGGQPAEIPVQPRRPNVLMIRSASTVEVGPTSLILRTADGGERSRPLSIVGSLPPGPNGPPDFVVPGTVGFGPGDLLDNWVNEFDRDDVRYFFTDVDNPDTLDQYEVASPDDFEFTIGGVRQHGGAFPLHAHGRRRRHRP